VAIKRSQSGPAENQFFIYLLNEHGLDRVFKPHRLLGRDREP